MARPLLALLLLPVASLHALLLPGEVVGIDLGTTTSAIAVVRDGLPSIVRDAEGKPSLASCVALDEAGTLTSYAADGVALRSSKRVIGLSHAAARARLAGARGRPLLLSPPPPRRPLLLAEQLAEGADGELLLRAAEGGPSCSAVAVAQHLISSLLDRAEAECGVRASRAVIGVPTHFSEPQKEATLAAARAAGLDKVKLLPEPVAAALAYGAVSAVEDELVCVFDLGGGTLDVSVLQVGGGTVEVLATDGDAWLGGDDLDGAIAKYVAQREQLPPLASLGPSVWNDLVATCRKLKEKLTVSKLAELPWPPEVERMLFDGADDDDDDDDDEDDESWEDAEEGRPGARGELVEPISAAEVELLLQAGFVLDGPGFQTVRKATRAARGSESPQPAVAREAEASATFVSACLLSRQELHAACAAELERMKQPLLRAAAACAVRLGGEGKPARRARGAPVARPSSGGRRLERVLLVGAASKTPAVVEMVEQLAGVRPDGTSVPPELAVALGAAVQAGMLEGSVAQLEVFNVLEAALIRGVVRGGATQRQRKRGREPS
ncbi:hypothetical protein AB1Y20_001941 [Prymnesium parvum]|uniref:Uncharacterized protein n=1 Tax=Prymnesium parvum TaxID=97485 RepID=A0AB34J7N5_PRYPA